MALPVVAVGSALTTLGWGGEGHGLACERREDGNGLLGIPEAATGKFCDVEDCHDGLSVFVGLVSHFVVDALEVFDDGSINGSFTRCD